MMKIVFSIIVAFLSFFSFAEDAQATIHVEKIVLGSGCFWGAEKAVSYTHLTLPTTR